jgi:hypothetical protein
MPRLEDQLGGADGKPRKTPRIMTRTLGGKPDLEKSTCQGTLCADVRRRARNVVAGSCIGDRADGWGAASR